ncbi:DUF2306 domain-containing protein [Constantimarinum furrinae]|uniref:DUF2306 domain-containing protein n=1 Tax=Constantimarinum furrinae TaxID=2562285 RepID=A0A7G8PXB5_9FLAO|nr:DUF2306 domain-containing protein [Constantimarinum furrinae]QNJ98981.1 hypothetical protein ALE3EI_2445 [Constantimarinum furrinae]
MIRFLRLFFIVLSTIVVLILLVASVSKLLNLIAMHAGDLNFRPDSIETHYRDHLWLGYVHIVPGIIFLILGGYQFVPYFRNRYVTIHRLIGKLFLILSTIIFITAIALAAFYPFGNILESVVTFLFGSFLLYCTYKAYTTARNRKIAQHRKWVTRIYFIAIAVSTIRGIIALFMATGSDSMQSIFGLSFLIAFGIHLVLVELWIRYLAK